MSSATSAKDRMAAKRIRDGAGIIRLKGYDVTPRVFRMLATQNPFLKDVSDDLLKSELEKTLQTYLQQSAEDFFK